MRLRSLATPPANFSLDSRLPGRWKSFSANWKSGADISGRALLRTRRELVSFTASKAWDHPCYPDGARVLNAWSGKDQCLRLLPKEIHLAQDQQPRRV